jgi:hypothetical protein
MDMGKDKVMDMGPVHRKVDCRGNTTSGGTTTASSTLLHRMLAFHLQTSWQRQCNGHGPR